MSKISKIKVGSNTYDVAVPEGYVYMGIAHVDDEAFTPTQNSFWIASGAGTYTNYGGLVVAAGEVAVLKYNALAASNNWSKDVTGIEKVTISQNTQTGKTSIQVGSNTAIEITDTIFTNKTISNKVIKKLFLDLGTHEFSEIRGTLSREAESGKWGLMLYLDNVPVWHWWNSELSQVYETYDGIFMYAEFDWSQMTHGTAVFSIQFTDAVFASSNDVRNSIDRIMLKDGIINSAKIADGAINYTKLAADVTTFIYQPTTKVNINAVIKKAVIDVSNYNGSYSLDGLKIGILSRGAENLWGAIIRNSSDQNISITWMNAENSSQHITDYGLDIYLEFDWSKMNIGDALFNGTFTYAALNPKLFSKEKEIELPIINALTNKYYGQVGDSISEGVGLTETLLPNDAYNPISGTKKATYGYYIAKNNKMAGWHNYGKSGTTLGDVNVANEDHNGFSKENGRYTQMAENLDYISIFFGWNDAEYGTRMQKQMWIQETYSNNHLYPARNDSQYIGTDGYCTQAEYDAVNAVTGQVGSITYDNPTDYWRAKYIGTSSDSTNKTWWGAWNIILPYLIEKYPLAKILIILPYPTLGELYGTATKDVAKKWGLTVFDWADSQLFEYRDGVSGIVDGVIVDQFRRNNLTYDGLHPNENGYKYMYSSIGQKLLSI